MTYLSRRLGRLAPSRTGLTLAILVGMALAPRAASAVQSSELYRTQANFYGRFEARIRFAPGEGVVSSFFLWKDGSSSTTSWNELDFEKINSTCKLQTNIWTGKGTQSQQIDTPSFNICSDYHTYAFEWTPDYIAWSIDGMQIRKVTGSSVTEYTQNASQGMTIHFNTWEGNSTFGGTLDPSILPVHEYVSWVQYSSYANGAFQVQWREDFNASAVPSGWATGNWAAPNNLSTHNPANVTFSNGIAVLSMTADNATGNSGTPPADPTDSSNSGTGGSSATGGKSGTGGTSASGGANGAGGTSASGGTNGAGGTSATGSGGKSGAGGATASGGSNGSGGDGTGGNSTTGTGSGGTPGNATGGTPGNATGGALGTATGGATGTGGGAPSGDGSGQSGSSSGCSCRTGGSESTGTGALAALLILSILAASARRRRPARSIRRS